MNICFLNTARALSLGALVMLSACTGQLLDSFRYQNSKEAFNSQTEINTKVDLLWVVDNSSSMDIAQKNIREKVAGFAESYLTPNWDIRLGVITTDAYLANSVYSNYLNSQVGGSSGFRSVHLNDLITDRLGRGFTAGNDDKLAKLQSLGVSFTAATRGTFTGGYLFKNLVPAWGAGQDYARLVAGVRDGPITGLCMERSAYFFAPNPQNNPNILGPECGIRDAADRSGSATCLSPAGGQTGVTECVNTSLNDTVRTGKPIISTQIPSGYGGSETAWKQQLANDFMVNISVGSVGSGSERGLASISEFIDLNETSPSKFFREGSLRAVIILSDEDDQSVNLPSVGNVPAGFQPFTGYRCDLNTLVEANTDKFADALTYIRDTYKYCCSGGTCLYENLGCPAQIVNGESVKVGVCPNPTDLSDVDSFRSELTDYFYSLDSIEDEEGVERSAEKANYFVVSIVPTQKSVIDSLRQERSDSDDRLDNIALFDGGGGLTTSKRIRIPAVDYAGRYLEFTESVGNGSLALDIGEPDYGVILDHIGKTLIDKKSRFSLKFEPTQKSDILIKIIRANGSVYQVQESQYDFEGKTLIITDEALILSLKATDKLYIDYQPSSLE